MPSLPKHNKPKRTEDKPKYYGERKPTGERRTYNGHWKNISKAYRIANPLCELCAHLGKLTDASPGDFKGVTDHIVRVAAGGHVRDLNNFMTLCKDCHNRKTAAEGRGLTFETLGEYGEMLPVSRTDVLNKLKRDVLKIEEDAR